MDPVVHRFGDDLPTEIEIGALGEISGGTEAETGEAAGSGGQKQPLGRSESGEVGDECDDDDDGYMRLGADDSD